MASELFDARSPQEDVQPKRKGLGTTIVFCDECRDMMVPRAPDNPNDPLEYYCNTCGRKKRAEDNRVFVNLLQRTVEESYLSSRHVSDDPTLKRVREYCPNCTTERICARFLAPAIAGEEQFRLMSECTHCRYQFEART